jgi:hypothetical protein
VTIEWPILWVEEDDQFPQIGTPELEWQGKPLTIPTIDEWRLGLGRDSIATLTVQIPVIVRTRPKSRIADHYHAPDYDHTDDTSRDGHVHASTPR